MKNERFGTAAEVLLIHPRLPFPTLRRWAEHCPALGRAVRSKKTSEGARLFRLDDVAAAVADIRDGELGDTIEADGVTWFWAHAIRRSPLSIDLPLSLLDRWSGESGPGCPWLPEAGGQAANPSRPVLRKLARRVFRSWSMMTGRQYFRLDELRRVIAARKAGKVGPPPSTSRIGWIGHREICRLFSASFRQKYIGSRNRPGVPHPALGRGMTVEFEKVLINGRPFYRKWCRADDVQAIQSAGPPAELWASLRQARREYRLTGNEVLRAKKAGRLNPEVWPMPPKHARPAAVEMFLRSELVAERKRLDDRKWIAGVKPFDVRRTYTDPDGRKFLPHTEAARRAGFHLAGLPSSRLDYFRTNECEFLDGRRIEFVQVDGETVGSPKAKIIVYLVTDLDRIREKLTRAKRTPKPPTDRPWGRPAKEAGLSARIASLWKAFCTGEKEQGRRPTARAFAELNSLDPDVVSKQLHRVRGGKPKANSRRNSRK